MLARSFSAGFGSYQEVILRLPAAYLLTLLSGVGEGWGMARKSFTATELAHTTRALKEAEIALVEASNRYLQIWKSFPGAARLLTPLGFIKPPFTRELEPTGIAVTVANEYNQPNQENDSDN